MCFNIFFLYKVLTLLIEDILNQ